MLLRICVDCNKTVLVPSCCTDQWQGMPGRSTIGFGGFCLAVLPPDLRDGRDCFMASHSSFPRRLLWGGSAGWAVLFCGLLANVQAEGDATAIRVAVYDDAGSGADAMKGLMSALEKEPALHVSRVRAAAIRAGELDACDVVIFPGGMSTTQGRTLGEDGRERVRTFVRGGGGYVGFCAGAYLASCDRDYDWSLNILNANVIDKEHWARGVGKVDLSLTEEGRRLMGISGDRLNIYYHQGPLLAPAGRTDLAAYAPVASFETEVAKAGVAGGLMKGSTAVAAARFGGGKVLCFSPHPEMTEGLHEIVHRSIRWAARPPARLRIVAHRGASFDAPENTLAAINMAWVQAADAVRLDVMFTQDGYPVVVDESRISQVGGASFSVSKQTLASLRQLDVGFWKGAKYEGERIPTLAQALANVPSGKSVFIEIKCGSEGVAAILKTIEASGLACDQLRIIARAADAIAASKSLRPDLQASWSIELPQDSAPKDFAAIIAQAQAIHADGVDISAESALAEKFAAGVKEAGLRLDVRAVHDVETVRKAMAGGAATITTDRPEWLRTELALPTE